MNRTTRNGRLLRSVIFENLYSIQKGMYEFRRCGEVGELRECFGKAFGNIIASANRTGYKDIADFCELVLDTCKKGRWTEIGMSCAEVFRLISSAIDWMLIQLEPEIGGQPDLDIRPLMSRTGVDLLNDLGGMLGRNMNSNRTIGPLMKQMAAIGLA